MTDDKPVSERTLRKRRRAAGEPPQKRGRRLLGDDAVVRLTVTIPPTLKAALEEEARTRGCSVSALVVEAFRLRPAPVQGQP